MKKKQIIFVFGKIVLALLVLVILFHKINGKQVWGHVYDGFRMHPLLIAAGIGASWFTVLVAALRWHQLLAAFGIAMPLRSAICIVQIGQFFLTFLPGPTGDDLTRMLYISRLSSKGHVGEACTTVLLDRCIGLASILMMALLCIPWKWDLLAASPQTHWLVVGITAAGAAVFIAVVLFFVLDGGWMQRIVEMGLRRLPESRITNELVKICKHVFFNKWVIAKVLAAAMGTQLILCTLFCFAGLAVDIHISFLSWLGFVPIVLAASALPITPLGAGVREALVVLFLGVIAPATHPEQATAASLIAFTMMLAVCLLGGVVYIFYRPGHMTHGKSSGIAD